MSKTSDVSLKFASEILLKIQNKVLNPEELTAEQRRVCVRFLIQDRKMTKLEMAEVLHVSRETIYQDKKALEKNDSGVSLMIDEIEIVNDLVSIAECAVWRLFRKGKEKDAFDVYDKFVDRLQSLGYVKRVAQEFNLKGQISLLEVFGIVNTTPSESTARSTRLNAGEDESILGLDQNGSSPSH